MSGWILLPVLLPVLAGACMLGSSAVSKWKGRPQPDAASLRRLHLAVCGVLSVSAVLALLAAWSGEHEVTLFYLMKDIPVYFRIDEIGRLFVLSLIHISTVNAMPASLFRNPAPVRSKKSVLSPDACVSPDAATNRRDFVAA